MKYEELINAFKAGEAIDLKSRVVQKSQYIHLEDIKQTYNCDKNTSQFVENGFEDAVKDNVRQNPKNLKDIKTINYTSEDENANRLDQEENSNDYYKFHDGSSAFQTYDKTNKFKDKNATGSFSGSQYLNDELKDDVLNTESDISALNNENELNTNDLSIHFTRMASNKINNNMNISTDKSVIYTPLLSAIERADMSISHSYNAFNQITNTYNTFGDILNTDPDSKVDVKLLSKSELLEHERDKMEQKSSPYNKLFDLEGESPLYNTRENEMKKLCGFEMSLNNSRDDVYKNDQRKENIFTYHNNDKHISFDLFKEQTMQRKLTQSPISPSNYEKDKEVNFFFHCRIFYLFIFFINIE